MYVHSHQVRRSQISDADDFLDSLLHDSSSSSATASPLWSPCTTHNGSNEDPLTDPANSPNPTSYSAFPAFDVHVFSQRPPPENRPPQNERKPDVSIDLGKTIKKERFAQTD